MAADDSTQRDDGIFVATNHITCVCQYPGWIVQDKTEFPSLHRAYDVITIISKPLKCDIADYDKHKNVIKSQRRRYAYIFIQVTAAMPCLPRNNTRNCIHCKYGICLCCDKKHLCATLLVSASINIPSWWNRHRNSPENIYHGINVRIPELGRMLSEQVIIFRQSCHSAYWAGP